MVLTILKMMEFVNGKDDISYMKWKITNVPNHQPAVFCSVDDQHVIVMKIID